MFCRFDDGSPVREGAAVEGVVAQETRFEVTKGLTRAAGSARLFRPEGGGDLRYQGVLAAAVDGPPSWVTCDNWYHCKPFIVDVLLEGPPYRPGETARWKIVVRERQDGRSMVPEARLRLTVKSGGSEQPLRDKKEFALDGFGAAHGEVAIPEDVGSGPVGFEMELVDDAGAVLGSENVWDAFQVDRFVAPSLVASVELASGPEPTRSSCGASRASRRSTRLRGPRRGRGVMR